METQRSFLWKEINGNLYCTLEIGFDFLDFIECFTTTFLHAHSWLNWVDEDDDEDEVGLKENVRQWPFCKKN